MREEFINPNWHVILVHYPLALVTLGALIELFAFLWRKSPVRTAAKWMILLGTLSMVPTATTGLYAFKDAAAGSSTSPDGSWETLKQGSRWGTDQWEFMDHHIWWSGSAAVICLFVVLVYMGSSDAWRRWLHVPLLLVLLFAVGLASGGAYWSGEAVYRHHVAVEPQSTENAVGTAVTPSESYHRYSKYASPLQVHLLGAGLAIAVSWAALGLTFRKWAVEPSAERQETELDIAEVERRLMIAGPIPGSHAPNRRPEPPQPPAKLYPARWWVVATLLAMGTAAAGVWYTEGSNWQQMPGAREVLTKGASAEGRQSMPAEQKQLLYHILLGGTIVVLPLLLAALVRVTRSRILTVLFSLLLLGAVGLQVWMGVLLLYHLPFRQ